MKYLIPSLYLSDKPPIFEAWRDHFRHATVYYGFREWLTLESGSDNVSGNFEDGWVIEFEDEAKYTWFVLKWG